MVYTFKQFSLNTNQAIHVLSIYKFIYQDPARTDYPVELSSNTLNEDLKTPSSHNPGVENSHMLTYSVYTDTGVRNSS